MGLSHHGSSGRRVVPQGLGLIPRPFRAGFLLAAVALAAASLPASAQDADAKRAVGLKRLWFEKKCYFEEWKEKGVEEQFLRRLDSQRKVYDASRKAEIPAFDELYAECLWARANHYREKSDLSTACNWASKIMELDQTSKKVADLSTQADELVLSYSLARAEVQEKGGNLDNALQEYRKCLRTRQKPSKDKAVAGVVRIVCLQQGLKEARSGDDLMLLVEALDRILDELGKVMPPEVMTGDFKDIKDLATERDAKANSLSNADVTFQDLIPGFQGEAATLTQAAATFSFTPVTEGGEAWPKDGGSKAIKGKAVTLRVGTYEARVFLAAAGADPVAVYLKVVLVAKSRTPLTIPTRVPEGMVFVGPWAGGGNFFIDRTEVTVEQVTKLAGGNADLATVLSDSKEFANPLCPAWFAEEKGVQAWESVTGKKVPTADQWREAAFGPFSARERPYPWGTDGPVPDTHGYFGHKNEEKPRPGGSFPRGASPFGLQDTVGNMVEWVSKDGGFWVIGGHYQLMPDVLFGAEGRSWIRDPLPGPLAFKGLKDQKAYQKFNYGGVDAEPPTSGLRMVVPVK